MATSDSLEKALQAAVHEDSSVRQGAALYLGTHADDSIARELVSLLISEPDFYVRETLTWAVVTRAEATYPLLLDALADTGHDRVQVLHALSKIRRPEAVAEILPLVADPDEQVAAKARWVLGRTGTPGAVSALVDHLGETEDFSRRELTRALEQAGPAAVDGLVERLLHDPDDSVRRHAAEALSGIGDPPARPAVGALIHVVGHDEAPVVLPAMEALAGLNHPDVDDTLRGLRDGPDQWLSITAGWLLEDRARR